MGDLVPWIDTGKGVRFSVLVCTYFADSAAQLRIALESIGEQSRRADEVVIVLDGPVPRSNERAVQEFVLAKEDMRIKTLELPENVGLGRALRAGVAHCSGNWIVRMDADDISVPTRLAELERYILQNPSVDVITSWATVEDPSIGTLYLRRTPLTHERIMELGKFRYPLNHPACAIRLRSLVEAGGYRSFSGLEDYDLFARLAMSGARFGAVPLVLYRLGDGLGQLRRRRGLGRALQQCRLQLHFFRSGYLSGGQALRNALVRVIWALLPEVLTRRLRIRFGV